jgi:hypothetical protein
MLFPHYQWQWINAGGSARQGPFRACCFEHLGHVGAWLARDSDLEGAIAGKPCSYKGNSELEVRLA